MDKLPDEIVVAVRGLSLACDNNNYGFVVVLFDEPRLNADDESPVLHGAHSFGPVYDQLYDRARAAVADYLGLGPHVKSSRTAVRNRDD